MNAIEYMGVTEITIDFADLDNMREVMEKYHDTETMLVGENTDGEMTLTSIFEDYIVLVTYQNNYWVRKNIFHWDGTVEELFDGKWEE